MDLPTHSFKNYRCREAFAVEKRIVYFGTSSEMATFMLEVKKGSEELKVVRVG